MDNVRIGPIADLPFDLKADRFQPGFGTNPIVLNDHHNEYMAIVALKKQQGLLPGIYAITKISLKFFPDTPEQVVDGEWILTFLGTTKKNVTQYVAGLEDKLAQTLKGLGIGFNDDNSIATIGNDNRVQDDGQMEMVIPIPIDPWEAGAIRIAKDEEDSSDDDVIPESRYVINRPKPFENRSGYMGATDCIIIIQHELLMNQALRERWCKRWGKQYPQYFADEDTLIANFVTYRSALDVWGEKTGREEPVISETLMARFEMGNLYEPIISTYAVDKRQLKFVKRQPEFQMGNIRCHPDYIVTDGKEQINLEVTTVNPLFTTTREHPSLYKFLQTQIQMGCANLKNSIIAVAFGFHGIDLFDVSFEPELFDEICQIVEAFWKNHVVADAVPPSPILDERLVSLASKIGQTQRRLAPTEGEAILADDELNSLYREFNQLSQQEKEVSVQLDNYKRKFQNLMISKSASVINFSDVTCELKTNKNGVKSLRFSKPKQ